MPEARIVSTTYDSKGNIVEQITRIISDEELAKEALLEEVNSTHIVVAQAIKSWDKVTLAQKDQLLKFLAKFYLVADEKLNLWPTGQ